MGGTAKTMGSRADFFLARLFPSLIKGFRNTACNRRKYDPNCHAKINACKMLLRFCQTVSETQNAQSTLKFNLGEWVESGGIDESSQNSAIGNLANNRQTSENRLRILVKVDKAD